MELREWIKAAGRVIGRWVAMGVTWQVFGHFVTSAVVALVLGVWAAVEGLPPAVAVILGLAAFVLVLVIWNFFTASRPGVTVATDKPDFVAEALEFNREHLARMIVAVHVSTDAQHLADNVGPHLDFVFQVLSGSLLPIHIDHQARGHIQCSGRKLQLVPEVLFPDDKPGHDFKYGWWSQFTIRQQLSVEEARWIMGQRPAWCSFGEVKVDVSADGVTTHQLDLNWGHAVTLPI